MQVKKHPNADLNRNSGLYFVIGLTLVLFVTWRALEYKSYEQPHEELIHMVDVPMLDENVPKTEQIRTAPPPPPPAAPEVIEVVEDTEEIEETLIESTEMTQETVVADVDLEASDIEVVEEEEEISVPFAVIEEVPVFPGCEGVSREEQRTCFQQKIQEHIARNFQYPETATELGIQGKVYVLFYIGTDGQVAGIETRGPDKMLEAEARRIIASLPQMKPGRQRNKNVRVPYSIPINFKLL
ncbi:energy transducer TonB [Robiginitalea biformata]|uniref:TonB protein, putative n=1 Tax=Robiginitalea biformata (strain ATCC BAA-864 / DSM 15991 / KCTC 12146 / HTCC2501) TaxID=313596 RepID=A4CMZ1_ROBBH|nr:energy transducer TonB [Robiginitalea biformata]EAR15033.1 tonB protein, putative [Robiginitalea biformata HTCC2501]